MTPSREEILASLKLGFLANYGNFLALWSTFELMIEVILMRQLRLSPEENSIVFAGSGFGAKMNVLYSLLNRDKANAKGVRLLRHAQQIAERNSFAHGFFRINKEKSTFALIKREVKDTYEVRRRVFDFNEMDQHLASFTRAFIAIRDHFGVSTADLDAYAEPIEARGLARASLDKPRPESRTSSAKAKRKSRAPRHR